MNGCKACLNVIENDEHIFFLSDIYMNVNSPSETISIKEKLADCVPELRDMVNNAVMCKRCVISLMAAYDFRQQCLEVQRKVCSYLQQMPVNTAISMEQIALHYKRQEDLAEEGNTVTEAVHGSNNACLTASGRNVVIKMETLPAMQEENLVTEVVYKSANTCLTPKKPIRNKKMERSPMYEEGRGQGENSLIIAADLDDPDELNTYRKMQSLQQQPIIYPENPAFTTENYNANSFSTSDGLNTYNRIQDLNIIPNDMHNNITESLVMQEIPKHAETSVKKRKTSFACSTCSYKSTNKSALKHHDRIHKEKYCIQCPSCNYRCKSIYDLHSHMKFKHYYSDGHGSISFHDDILRGKKEQWSKKKRKRANYLQKQIQLVSKMLPIWLQQQGR